MIDLTKVFPRIKELYKDDEITSFTSDNGQEIQFPDEDLPIVKTIAQDLGVAYAIDEGSYYRFVANKDVTGDLSIDELHKAAVKNMIDEIADKIGWQGDVTDLVMITNGGNFEAAMILMNEHFWSDIKNLMGGDFYIAIPARDLLFVTPKNNNGIERLKVVINNYFNDSESNGLLVKHIYTYNNSAWQVIETA